MAIKIISGEDAWSKTGEENKYKFWPSRKLMSERLSPIATPVTQASFKIHSDEKVFCIGSCFAREISEALHRLNYNVLSIFRDLPKSPHRNFSNDEMFNKYNVAAIYNELTWALNPRTPYQDDDVFIDVGNNYFQDYQLKGNRYSDELEAAHAFRKAFNQAFSAIKEADVVILTLGLSEVWFDKHTRLFLNATVPPELIKRYPERFELHVFDYQQTWSFLNDIYELLKTYLKPSFRLLITVSPVPLFSTFRQQDVLIANSYSKAVLRAAVEQFVIDKNNVNYFPSYEFVTLSNPSVVWRDDDFRHVDSTFIDYIMGNVMAQFTEALPTIHENNLLLKAKSLYYGNFLEEAQALLTLLIKTQPKPDKELLWLWSAIQLGMNGKYKSLWFKAGTYLKNHRHLNIRQHVTELLYRYRKLSHQFLKGHVDIWDGHYLIGWAVNLKRRQPVRIKILVNNRVISTLLADNAIRPDVAKVYGQNYLHCGFRILLEYAQLDNHAVRVVFADTGEDLVGSPVYFDRQG